MLRCPHCGQDETFRVHEWLDHHILIRCTADDYTTLEETQVDEITWGTLTCTACERPTSEHAALEAAQTAQAGAASPTAGAPADPPGLRAALRRQLDADGADAFLRWLLGHPPLRDGLAAVAAEAQAMAQQARATTAPSPQDA